MTSERVSTSPSAVLALVSSELARWSSVIEEMGAKLQSFDHESFELQLNADERMDGRKTPNTLWVAASMGSQQPRDAELPQVPAISITDTRHPTKLSNYQQEVSLPELDDEALSHSQGSRISDVQNLHDLWKAATPKCEEGSTPSSLDVERQEVRRTSIRMSEVVQKLGPSELTALSKTSDQARGLHPHNRWVFAWAVIGGMLILYDIIIIPIQWVFDDSVAIFTSLDYVAAFYWTLDIGIHFFVGFETAVGIEVRLQHIARYYLKGWLIPDICAALLDWIFILQGRGGFFSRSWHIIRVSRTLRTLPRSIKIVNLAQVNIDRRLSERFLFLTKVCFIVFSVVFLAHYIACGWYAVGKWSIEHKSTSWLQEGQHENADLPFLYLASLDWSLAQSGLATVDIYPTNAIEHLFSMIVTVIWIAMMPNIISCMGILLNNIQELEKNYTREMAMTRKYLKERSVPGKLTTTIIRFVRLFHASQSAYVQESTLPILGKLPLSMQFQLAKHIYLPILKSHPLFQKFASICKIGAGAICYLSMAWRHYEVGDEVFLEGQQASEMIFVVAGKFKYFPRGRLIPINLGPGTWAGEASLWSSCWTHKGHLVADKAAEIAVLDASKFRVVMAHGESMHWPIELLRSYASSAVSYLNRSDDTEGQHQSGEIERQATFTSSVSGVSNVSSRSAGMDCFPVAEALRATDDAFEPWKSEAKRTRYLFAKRASGSFGSFLSQFSSSSNSAGFRANR